MFDRLEDEAKAALDNARRCAADRQSSFLDDLHVLVGVCRLPDSLAVQVLIACGQDPIAVVARAEGRLARLPGKASGTGQLPFTPTLQRAFEGARTAAEGAGQAWIGSHHLLIGLLKAGGGASEILRSAGLTVADATRAACDLDRQAPAAAERGASVPDAWLDPRVSTLRAAQQACVELGQLELASQLRDLAQLLEHGA